MSSSRGGIRVVHRGLVQLRQMVMTIPPRKSRSLMEQARGVTADFLPGIIAAIRNAKHSSPRKPVNSTRMTKPQLIEKVAAKTELGKAEAAVVVDSVLDLIA